MIRLIIQMLDNTAQEVPLQIPAGATSLAIPSVGHIVQGTNFSGYYFVTRVTEVVWDVDRGRIGVHAKEITPDER